MVTTIHRNSHRREVGRRQLSACGLNFLIKSAPWPTPGNVSGLCSQCHSSTLGALQCCKVAQAGSGRHAQWHNPQTGRTWTVLRLWWDSSTSDNNSEKPSPVRETVLLYKFLGNNYRNQSLNMFKSHLQNVMFDKLPSNNISCKYYLPNLMAYTCDLSTGEAETEGSQLSVSLVYRVSSG